MTGGPPQLSEPDAAALSTPTDKISSEHAVLSLCILCQCLLAQMQNPDAVWLALTAGGHAAQSMGVPTEAFDRVRQIIFTNWKRGWERDPIAQALFT